MQILECDSQQHQPYLNWTPPISYRFSEIWERPLAGGFAVSDSASIQHFRHGMCRKGWRSRHIPVWKEKYENNTIVRADDAAVCLHVILPGLKGGSEFITCANTWLQVTMQHIPQRSQPSCTDVLLYTPPYSKASSFRISPPPLSSAILKPTNLNLPLLIVREKGIKNNIFVMLS